MNPILYILAPAVILAFIAGAISTHRPHRRRPTYFHRHRAPAAGNPPSRSIIAHPSPHGDNPCTTALGMAATTGIWPSSGPSSDLLSVK